MRLMQRIFPRPRSFPPSTRRALPASSPTSSVLRPRPTYRRSLPQLVVCCLPGVARRSPSPTNPRRDLPAPVQEPVVNVPSSRTSGSSGHPRPLFSDPALGLPHFGKRRLSRYKEFRGSITRPAHSSSYASPRGSPHAAQGLDFLGVDSSQGRTCSSRRCLLLSLTYLLLPVCAGAPKIFGVVALVASWRLLRESPSG